MDLKEEINVVCLTLNQLTDLSGLIGKVQWEMDIIKDPMHVIYNISNKEKRSRLNELKNRNTKFGQICGIINGG